MVLGAGDGYDLVEEVGEWEDDFTGLLTHDFEETTNLECGGVDDVEGVVLLGAVCVGLHTNKVFQVDVIALTQQL